MKVNLTGSGVVGLAAIVGLVALALWVRKSGSAAAAAAVEAVNPASDRNLVNRGVSAVGAAVTGEDSWTLGGQLAEWFSPSVRAADEALRAPARSVDRELLALNDERALPGTGAGTGVTGGW